jgi:hypothetical protein
MSGYIVVVPTPYFAVTDKDGNFTIKDVPPGQYTLRTWSEQAKPATQAVTVTSATDAGAQSACNSTPCSCAATRITNVNLTVMK